MYIVAIAWFFVAIMIAVTQPSLTAGVLSLLGWGIVPVCLILWIVGTPARLHRKRLPSNNAVGTEVSARSSQENVPESQYQSGSPDR